MKLGEINSAIKTVARPKLTSAHSAVSLPGLVGRVLDGAGDIAKGLNLPLEISQLLQEQFRMQMIMLNTSLISNVSKTKHEAAMAPVRNIRGG